MHELRSVLDIDWTKRLRHANLNYRVRKSKRKDISQVLLDKKSNTPCAIQIEHSPRPILVEIKEFNNDEAYSVDHSTLGHWMRCSLLMSSIRLSKYNS